MEANPSGAPGLKRSLSVWAAVGLSVALMAPSMAANINPQASATTAGRAVPLTFLIAAIGVLLVAYSFVRLCQYFHHSGSVYAFVGATLGPRAGVVAGWGLLGTYTFYAVVTASAAGIFGTAFLQAVGIWPQPALVGAVHPARGRAGAGAAARHHAGQASRERVLSVEAPRCVHPGRHRGGAGPPAGRKRTRPPALHLERVQGDAGDEFLRRFPGRGVRLLVVRRVRGGVHPGRGDQPADP